MMGRTSGMGVDFSANPVSLASATLLKTIAVNYGRTGYLIQNNDAADMAWVSYDDGASGTPTIFAIASSGVASGQGGSMSYQSMPHAGRIRIYGANATTKVSAREW